MTEAVVLAHEILGALRAVAQGEKQDAEARAEINSALRRYLAEHDALLGELALIDAEEDRLAAEPLPTAPPAGTVR
jgi:hypothetical protein